MIKKTITYTDFAGNKRTEDHYFNLSKAELVELEFSKEKGLQDHLKAIVAAEDIRGVIAEFKEVIKASYGVRSEDGRRFTKSPELLAEFMETNAYSELFLELAGDAGKAKEFFEGVIPQDLDSSKQRAVPQDHLSKKTSDMKVVEAPIEIEGPQRNVFEGNEDGFRSRDIVVSENRELGRMIYMQGDKRAEIDSVRAATLDEDTILNYLKIHGFEI